MALQIAKARHALLGARDHARETLKGLFDPENPSLPKLEEVHPSEMSPTSAKFKLSRERSDYCLFLISLLQVRTGAYM